MANISNPGICADVDDVADVEDVGIDVTVTLTKSYNSIPL